MNSSFSNSLIRLFLVSATTGGRVSALTPAPQPPACCAIPNFPTSFIEMPAGEGIGTSKNRSNVEKHPFDLFFADSLKMSEMLSED
jgi:hypothetical protein